MGTAPWEATWPDARSSDGTKNPEERCQGWENESATGGFTTGCGFMLVDFAERSAA